MSHSFSFSVVCCCGLLLSTTTLRATTTSARKHKGDKDHFHLYFSVFPFFSPCAFSVNSFGLRKCTLLYGFLCQQHHDHHLQVVVVEVVVGACCCCCNTTPSTALSKASKCRAAAGATRRRPADGRMHRLLASFYSRRNICTG